MLYYMMTNSSAVVLGQRLNNLKGTAGKECILTYRTVAQDIAKRRAFREVLRFHAALSDRNRLLALSLLKYRSELCACEIQAALGISHPAVSHQMGILVSAGLVEKERSGKWIHYRLTPKGAEVVP